MKKYFCLVLLLLINTYLFSQEKTLKIYSITEYIDGYVILGIDTTKSDTLMIISKKEIVSDFEKYSRLEVGELYLFQIDDKIRKMAAMPPENFTVRIVTTIIWKNGDEIKNIPVFAKNIKDRYIQK
jgi:hypothetical protein